MEWGVVDFLIVLSPWGFGGLRFFDKSGVGVDLGLGPKLVLIF